MTELFQKIVEGFYPFTIFIKNSNTDVWQGHKYFFPANIYLLKVFYVVLVFLLLTLNIFQTIFLVFLQPILKK